MYLFLSIYERVSDWGSPLVMGVGEQLFSAPQKGVAPIINKNKVGRKTRRKHLRSGRIIGRAVRKDRRDSSCRRDSSVAVLLFQGIVGLRGASLLRRVVAVWHSGGEPPSPGGLHVRPGARRRRG